MLTIEIHADGRRWPNLEAPTVAVARKLVLTMMKAGCRDLTAEVIDEAGEVVAYKPERGPWVSECR